MHSPQTLGKAFSFHFPLLEGKKSPYGKELSISVRTFPLIKPQLIPLYFFSLKCKYQGTELLCQHISVYIFLKLLNSEFGRKTYFTWGDGMKIVKDKLQSENLKA
jgi:hypothetical protein